MGHAQLKCWKGGVYICLESAQTIWSCVHINAWCDRHVVYIFVHVCMATEVFDVCHTTSVTTSLLQTTTTTAPPLLEMLGGLFYSWQQWQQLANNNNNDWATTTTTTTTPLLQT
jgi:hypothetical protein